MERRPAAGALLCATVLFVLHHPFAQAQSYPSKYVKIITAAPGSANDLVARIVGQEMVKSLGQQVVVENRGGLAIEATLRAPADGYTVMFYGSAVWTTPLMREDIEWHPLRDLVPIALAVDSPNVLVVHPSLPVKSVKELVALAKARPRMLNYGAGTPGASPHLSTELFKAMTGTEIVRIGYKGTGPSVAALLAGEVQMMFAGAGSVTTYIRSGKLRALAVASETRSALVPGVPTVSEAGVPGYESASRMGYFAPAKTPMAIVDRLNRDINQALDNPEVKGRLFDSGIETVGGKPHEFSEMIAREMAKWGKLIRDGRLREDGH